MPKIIIIPDCHGRTFWKTCIPYVNDCEKIIFLGDYLDPYGYEGITYEDAMSNFQEIIKFKRDNFDKVILLEGNHDCHYHNSAFRNEGKGSRYDYLHAADISQMFWDNHDCFQVAYETNIKDKRYIFTHGGITKTWLNFHNNILGNDINVDIINNLSLDKWGIFGEVSRLRGGFYDAGGLMWTDVIEQEDPDNTPFENVYQIFGHTQQEKDPIITENYACLDCRKAFQLNDDGTIEELKEKTLID